ncbi:MAG: ComF family protein [Candidatus Levyibacteriota bacterium]
MFAFLLDYLFPKRCVGCKKIGRYLCDNCFSGIELYQEFVCPMCLKRSITGQTHPGCIYPYAIDGLISGVVYKGVVKRLLYRFKFSPFISDLKHTVGSLFTETVSQNELFMRLLSSHPIVTVVPLSSRKLKNRGYNQADLLAGSLAQEFRIPKIDSLVRIKITKPQFKLDKKQRIQNVQHAFQINLKNKMKIKNRIIFLVDDLSTSCATLQECAKVLKRNGAKKVYGVTFAREI